MTYDDTDFNNLSDRPPAKGSTATAVAHKPQETSIEVKKSAEVARATQEIQAAIQIAKMFPRNEDEARIKLLKACKRPAFADEAEYSFPRGGADVTGPSVNLAREAARVWGNIQDGFEVTQEDDQWRTIRCFAWDMETNTRKIFEDRFKKLIFRKKGGWIEPDERDLRELTNRRAAIGYRNAILGIIPKDMIEEALWTCRQTLENKAAQDPDGEKKRILDGFAALNVMPTDLERLLNHPIGQTSPAEMVELRRIWTSIRDGNSVWADYDPAQQVQGEDANLSNGAKDRLADIRARRANPQQPPTPAASATSAASPTEPQDTTATGNSIDPLVQAQEAQRKLDEQREQIGVGKGKKRDLEPATAGISGVKDLFEKK